jgi:hypothetical protein
MTRPYRSRIVFAAVLAALSVVIVRGQDAQPGPPDIPAGLVSALEGIGQNILGAAGFFVQPGPPDAEVNPGPPVVTLWIDDGSLVPLDVNVFANPGPPTDSNPGPPTTWLRITIENGSVHLVREQNTTIGNPDTRMDLADLSGFAPPNPVHPPNPIRESNPNLPSGLVRALEGIGQNILGAASFFAQPGPPNSESNPGPATLNLWIDDGPAVPVRINVFQNPGPPDADGNPGPPTTWLRITITNGAVTLLREQNTAIGNPDTRLGFADLSAFVPPNPVQRR